MEADRGITGHAVLEKKMWSRQGLGGGLGRGKSRLQRRATEGANDTRGDLGKGGGNRRMGRRNWKPTEGRQASKERRGKGEGRREGGQTPGPKAE
jgi:hypothetical protein